MTRGIRNNNPGNLRHGPDWLYLAEDQADPDFATFEHRVFGLRALALTLLTYSRKHHLYTVEGIIDRFAPPSDGNDTEAYIRHVCDDTGFRRDEPINLRVYNNMHDLMYAIIQHENGNQMPYTSDDFRCGITLAYHT